MLDVVHYPVSAILWFWHQIFGSVLDPAKRRRLGARRGVSRFPLRLVLYAPFVRQMRSGRAMQRLQPQIAALKKKHSADRQG